MSKKAEIRLGINSTDAQKDAKRVSKEIKQTIEKDLGTGIDVGINSKAAESAIARIKAAEAERSAKAQQNAQKTLTAEQRAASAAMDMEKRRAQMAAQTSQKRIQAEDAVKKKLEGMKNVMKNYENLATQMPSVYKGTANTGKDAARVSANADYMQKNLGSMSDKDLARLQKTLNSLTYKDLGKMQEATSTLAAEVARATAAFKRIDSVTKSLDKMQSAVDRITSSMEKSVKKISPSSEAAPQQTTQIVDSATKAATKASANIVKEVVQEQPTIAKTPAASTASTQAAKVAQAAIDPATLRNQFMSTLDHFQAVIAKTMPKANTEQGQEKIQNIHGLQERFSKSAILTTNMTVEQMTQVSAQMQRMASTTVREMQRGMTAIERMFKKMANEASKIDTSVLNYERKRQAGEKNLQTGVYKPSARSDTSDDDIASRVIKLLPAAKDMKLLEGPKGVDPSTYIKPLISQQQRAAESMAKAMERAARAADALAKQQRADSERGWEADYTGPTKREREPQLALPMGPQEQLNNMFKQIDFSALDKLAARLKTGEVVDPSKVPGGVASAQAAPNQLKGILDAIPNMSNEAAHKLLEQTKGMKFTTLEASINNIELTFQNISNLIANSAAKYAQAAPKEDVKASTTSAGAEESAATRVASALEQAAANAARMGQASVERPDADASRRAAAASELAARQAAAQQELITSSRKVMASFDALTEKIRANASVTDAEKAQWDANAKGIKSAMGRVEGAAGTAAPEATARATQMINEADITNAVQLRNLLEQISHTLGLSKQTLLRQAARDVKETGRSAKDADKSIKAIMKSFTQAGTASKFLATNTNLFSSATKKLKGTWEEVKRVVMGIMISRVFYAGIQQISAMAREVGNLIVQFEQAQVAMAVMLGDYDKSTRMMNELADFAAKTPLTNQQANKAGQMLLAYGFEAKNLMPIMRDLADATSAVGNPQAFESIARALGQINTKGKLSAEEIRQLTEQGIPAMAILRKELNLTDKEVSNIGKAGIPASAAISALLKGIQDRYGGAAEAISRTTGGMLSTIKDSILLVAKDALAPLKRVFDGILGSMVESLSGIIETLRTSGIGGVFEKLIPPEMQEAVRLFAANIYMLITAISKLWNALGPVRSMIMNVAVMVANFVLPIVNILVIALGNLANFLFSNAKVMQILTAALAGFAIGWAVTKIVFMLSKGILFMIGVMKGAVAVIQLLVKGQLVLGAVSTLTAGKVAILVGVIVGLVAIFAALTGKFNGFFNSFSKGIQGMFKVDSSKFFQKDMNDNTASVEEFGQEFDKNGEKMDEWGDKMKENADKAKNAIMAFDEVFTLTDPDAGKMDEDTGLDSDDSSINMPDIGQLPEIPDGGLDWDDFFNMGDFLDNFDGLLEWFSGLGVYFTSDYWRSLKTGGPWDVFFEGLAETIDGIELMFDGLAEFIAGIIMGDFAMIGEGWSNFWIGLGEGAKGLYTIVEGIVIGILGSIDELLTWLLGDAWTDFKKFNSNLGEDFALMGEGIKSVWNGLIDFLVGIITLDFERFAAGWKGIIDGIAKFFDGAISFIADLAGNLIEWLLDDFLRMFGWVGNGLADILDSIKIAIGKFIDGFKLTFSGLIDFIAGVFTADWERCWKGIKNIFWGIISAFGNLFIGVLNTLIDGLNWFIRQANKISFDVPDWVPDWIPGVKSGKFGINIPEVGRIPYLEKGGLVTKETLAVMGEGNKHEAVIPLENEGTMAEIARAITSQMTDTTTGTNAGGGDVNLNVGVLVADDRGIRKLKTMLDEVSEDMKRGRRG